MTCRRGETQGYRSRRPAGGSNRPDSPGRTVATHFLGALDIGVSINLQYVAGEDDLVLNAVPHAGVAGGVRGQHEVHSVVGLDLRLCMMVSRIGNFARGQAGRFVSVRRIQVGLT